MKHLTSRRLHAYWDSLRGGRPAPGRDEIDPAAIRDLLASVFVLDVAAVLLPRPADASFRLSGTRLDALFGRALRGSSFDRLWAPRSIALAGSALADLIVRRHPVVADARGGPTERGTVDLELLLLPLEYQGGAGGRVLGALSAATTPDWMGLSPTEPLELRPSVEPRPDQPPRTFGRRLAHLYPVRPGQGDTNPPATIRP